MNLVCLYAAINLVLHFFSLLLQNGQSNYLPTASSLLQHVRRNVVKFSLQTPWSFFSP
jgi:hypothetical protein